MQHRKFYHTSIISLTHSNEWRTNGGFRLNSLHSLFSRLFLIFLFFRSCSHPYSSSSSISSMIALKLWQRRLRHNKLRLRTEWILWIITHIKMNKIGISYTFGYRIDFYILFSRFRIEREIYSIVRFVSRELLGVIWNSLLR